MFRAGPFIELVLDVPGLGVLCSIKKALRVQGFLGCSWIPAFAGDDDIPF
jgi:hypothetical protein